MSVIILEQIYDIKTTKILCLSGNKFKTISDKVFSLINL